MPGNTRILVFWLEESLDAELRSVLGAESEALDSEAPASEDECLELIEGRCPDVVFCPSDPIYYQRGCPGDSWRRVTAASSSYATFSFEC